MGEYFRELNNRIQAGFALNTGKLLFQYRSLTANLPPTQKYEATLTICALQALLTTCTELMRAMKRNQPGFWTDPITDIPGHWGIRRSFIVSNNFPAELTYGGFITHLRNALSHPASPDMAPHPTTGYTTCLDGSNIIARFCFTNSPWVDRGCIHSMASSLDEEQVKKTLKSFQRNQRGASELKVENIQGKYQIYHGNQIYLPVFVAELPLNALTDLAINLANHMSQPTLANWDGRTIQQLVA